MACKAGSPALRKALRLFPQLELVGNNRGHSHLACDGVPVRGEDGRKIMVITSPRNDDIAAKELVRKLCALGYTPRRAA